jgi:competence protein ComEA
MRLKSAIVIILLSLSCAASQLIDINNASVKQLMILQGVGQKLAERIVKVRASQGGFASVDDLVKVQGFSEKLLERVRGEIEVKPLKMAQKAKPASTAASPKAAEPDVRTLFLSFENEPTITQVHHDAIETIQAQPDRILSWFSRARNAAWLPKVRGGAGRNLDQGQSLRKKIGEEDTFFVKDSVDLEFNAQLEWQLDELLFSRHELGAAREARRLHELRAKVLTQVTKDYFERRKLQVEEKLQGAGEAHQNLARTIRIAELTANIDAMTGGKFSANLR